MRRALLGPERSRGSAVVFALLGASLSTLAGCEEPEEFRPSPDAEVVEWVDYGGDRGGLRYSELEDVSPQNVARLEVAWIHHSGDVSDGKGEIASTSAYEVTPIMVDGTLYFCSPFNRVFALNPETGGCECPRNLISKTLHRELERSGIGSVWRFAARFVAPSRHWSCGGLGSP